MTKCIQYLYEIFDAKEGNFKEGEQFLDSGIDIGVIHKIFTIGKNEF